MIKLVAFDLDDTLYPEEEFILGGFKAVSEYINTNYRYNEDFLQLLLSLYRRGVRGDTFNRALSLAGIEYDEQLIKKLIQIYRAHKPNIRPFYDTEDVLKELSGRFKLGLITDGDLNTQKHKVQTLRIEAYFHKIVYTDEFGIGTWKPAQFAFKEMMRHFQLKGEQCVYAGDNPRKDFTAPKKLGWVTVRIIRQNGQHKDVRVAPELEAHNTVFSLRELPSLLRR